MALSLLPNISSNKQTSSLIALGAAASLAVYLFIKPPVPSAPYLPSPRTGLSAISAEKLALLPYPPDFFPGGRWVKTPYGTIRCYEFGPEKGRKIVYVHGISTPCVAGRDFLLRLVEEGGCRVLTFDLFGRGYSDAPQNVPYDNRLFIAEVLFALQSSPIATTWTSFSLIGYSLGGGISASFTTYFPHMIESLILIAPAGLLKSSRAAVATRLGRQGYLPTALMNYLAKRSFRKPLEGAEWIDPMHRGKILDVNAIAGWQAENHPGYVSAFISTLRYGPIFDRREEWEELGTILRDPSSPLGKKRSGILGKKALVIMGEDDETVKIAILGEIQSTLGEEVTKCVVLKGAGHDLVAKRGEELAIHMLEFWGMRKPERREDGYVDPFAFEV